METYENLEQELGKWCNNPRTIVCNSGTAALHLALEALDIPKGSCVLVPEFTMISCARAVSMAGLRPVFIDCRPDTLLMDLEQAAEYARNPIVKAIMPVHIYGRTLDMGFVKEIVLQSGLRTVEDLSEAHGAKIDYEGYIPDAKCWSFYQNKIVAGEEGGAIAFDLQFRADLAKRLRNHGFTSQHNFSHIPRGVNYRLANLLSGVILDSLSKIEENLAKRALVAQWYDERIPELYKMPSRSVNWVYDIKIRDGSYIIVNKVISILNGKGIKARHSFKPMSSQPEYLGHYKHLEAWRASQLVMYLPVTPDMSEQCVDRIVQGLLAVL